MELIFIIAGFLALITFVLPWINNSQIKTLRKELDYLHDEIQHLNSKMLNAGSKKPDKKDPVPTTTVEPIKESVEVDEFESWEDEQWEDDIPPIESSVQSGSSPRVSMAQHQETIKSTFEQNIATKAPVWIGAFSLICAAFFLVKYSIEAGLLGPSVRVLLGGLFGGGLLFAGQWVLKRPTIANAQRIAQGLIGAGLVSLYGSIYAATHLHDLIPTLIGFGGMTAVTAIAVVASLRHGQPIAVFGIIGGLLTPALLGADSPQAITLFTYLFILFSGVFIVLVRQRWWTLAIISLLGSLAWSGIWVMTSFTASDAPILILFSMGLTAVILSATGRQIIKGTITKEDSPFVHTLNGLAIAGGFATILWFSLEVSLTTFDWSMLGLLSVAMMALAYFDPTTYQKPLLIKVGASLALLLFWIGNQSFAQALPIFTSMSVLYIGGTGFIMRQVKDPRFWAMAQALTTLALYFIAFLSLEAPYNISWGMICLAIAGASIFQANDLRKKYNANTLIQDHLVAIYALTASAFISIGLATELPFSYLPLAFAGQIAATAWIYQKTNIQALQKIMLVLTFIFIGMNYEQILLFTGMALSSIFNESLSSREIKSAILSAPVLQLGGTSALMYLAYWLTPRNDTYLNERLVKVLFATATALALGLGYYGFRSLVHDGSSATIFENTLGFIDRGFLTIAIAAAGIGVFWFAQNKNIPSLVKWGNGLFAIAMCRIAYFDIIIYNPYFSSTQSVGNMPILNGVTLTYGFGAIIAGFMAYKYKKMTKPYGALALLSMFVFTTFTVRQFFHGSDLSSGIVSSAELYSYSVAWLIIGIGLLTSGIKFQSKSLRMASLGFMLLTVCKVFLIDAAELEGLLRVVSFLGLGTSLIGLSTFYTKFVFANEVQNKKA